jgi:S1-C subfamily serine protease
MRLYESHGISVLKHPLLRYDALVAIKTQIPDDALTASLLGTERTGHGVRIRDDGLIATIGYVINEAENLWITAADGTTVPGFVVGYDFDSGLGLVKPTLPLPGRSVEIGSAEALSVGDALVVASSGGPTETLECELVAKQEFAGRWEYLLDEALFTAPPHQSWSGAALVDPAGRLCGLGSLIIQGFRGTPKTPVVNMFVPIDLLLPIMADLLANGRVAGPGRPWLGVNAQAVQGKLVVGRVTSESPAGKAGLKRGDVILGVGGVKTPSLPEFYDKMWGLGDAGVVVPLDVESSGGSSRRIDVPSVNRLDQLKLQSTF